MAFSLLMQFLFAWLPHDLYVPVAGILGAAFLIVMVRILIALVQVISKIVPLFLGG